jgi:hypothetical protein
VSLDYPAYSAAQEVVTQTPHMATDVFALKLANQELADAVANMQRAMDQMQVQHALLAQALLNATRGQWDAARFGRDSVEAILVAINPALQGKVHAVPFENGQ